MTAPTTTRPRIIERRTGLYVHAPAVDSDHPANSGKCLAFARKRIADGCWEVCAVGTRLPLSVHRTRATAVDALRDLTGAVA